MTSRLDAVADKEARTRLDAPPKLEIGKHFQKANAENRSPAWISKLVAAMLGPGKLTLDEFFYYELYRPEFSADDCRLFVGKKAQRLYHNACNDWTWFAACHDKALFYTIMRGAGLAVPETLAIVSSVRRHGYPASLCSVEELAAFLDGRDDFPLFAKPIDGMFSIGTLKVTGCDGGLVRLQGHNDTPVDEIHRFMSESSEAGFLIQRTLDAEEKLAAVTGDTIASVRILVLLSETPEIASAVIKIPSGDSIADNFWRTGNALGAIDLETGTIARVIVNRADGQALPEPGDHRLSGLIGTRVPGWDKITALGTRAASVFPRIRTQSWDIAVSGEDPVLMEFNFGGDLNLHQLAHNRGALEPRYVAHLKRCGYRGKLP